MAGHALRTRGGHAQLVRLVAPTKSYVSGHFTAPARRRLGQSRALARAWQSPEGTCSQSAQWANPQQKNLLLPVPPRGLKEAGHLLPRMAAHGGCKRPLTHSQQNLTDLLALPTKHGSGGCGIVVARLSRILTIAPLSVCPARVLCGDRDQVVYSKNS
jgi:hypothetical protein